MASMGDSSQTPASVSIPMSVIKDGTLFPANCGLPHFFSSPHAHDDDDDKHASSAASPPSRALTVSLCTFLPRERLLTMP
jgi:hypothetical protein